MCKILVGKMKIKKTLISFCLLLISLLGFCGCANVEFYRAVDANDTIIDMLVVTLDESKLDKTGRTSFASVKMAVYDDMMKFEDYVYEWIKSFEEDYVDVYLALKDGIRCEVRPAEENQLVISLEFSDWSMFGVFYGMTEIKNVE